MLLVRRRFVNFPLYFTPWISCFFNGFYNFVLLLAEIALTNFVLCKKRKKSRNVWRTNAKLKIEFTMISINLEFRSNEKNQGIGFEGHF